jgi:group I intron endonuclease
MCHYVIYKITNLENSKYYVGSSSNVKVRFRDHQRKLNTGKHANIYLQRAWDKYGKDAFVFKVTHRYNSWVEMVAKEDEALAAHGREKYTYNIQLGSQSPRHSGETKAKIGIFFKGKKRKPRAKEHCKNLSESLKGNKIWEGKNHTEASRDKMGKEVVAISPSGERIEYKTISKLRESLNTSVTTVHRALNTNSPVESGTHAGWFFEYKEGTPADTPDIPEEYLALPRTRQGAKDTGAKSYFTGKPCKRGHVSPRKTKGVCLACQKEDYAKEYRAKRAKLGVEAYRAQANAYYKRCIAPPK